MAMTIEEELDRAHRLEREAQVAWLDAVRRGASEHQRLWDSWDRRVDELHELGTRMAESVDERERKRR
jgi:hypothetical protein